MPHGQHLIVLHTTSVLLLAPLQTLLLLLLLLLLPAMGAVGRPDPPHCLPSCYLFCVASLPCCLSPAASPKA
jgi:hypothetical protein